MKINELRPMLWTEDIKGSIAFYTDVLGFVCGEHNTEWGWASLSLDGVGVMFSRPNTHIGYEKIGFTGSLYFNTDDVDAMWEKVKDKARVCYGIEDFDYGMREFAVFDNNGYLLQFGREIES